MASPSPVPRRSMQVQGHGSSPTAQREGSLSMPNKAPSTAKRHVASVKASLPFGLALADVLGLTFPVSSETWSDSQHTTRLTASIDTRLATLLSCPLHNLARTACISHRVAISFDVT